MYKDLISPPDLLMCCPACKASVYEGFELGNLQCSRCNTDFFSIDNIPCLFANGKQQKHAWESTLGPMFDQWRTTIEQNTQDLKRRDLISALRGRLATMIQLDKTTYNTFQDLIVNKTGLTMRPADQNSLDSEFFSGYQSLLFRDWCWEEGRQENNDALQRLLANIEEPLNNGEINVLILGSGAGRLGWDLHCTLKPQATVALDYNPILSIFAKRLIRDGESVRLGDTRPYPQSGQIGLQDYELKCSNPDKDLAKSWYPLAADVTSAPLNKNSFDLIISPWFVDVCGQEMRDTIAQIDTWLKPGGQWVNSGPLLYMDPMPYVLRYTFEEIKEFIALSGMEFQDERHDLVTYLKAPNDNRITQEEVWTFSVRKPKDNQYKGEHHEPPDWMVMTHIPVPEIKLEELPDHPIIIETYKNINGKNSINYIASVIEDTFSPECDCVELVIGLIDEYIFPREKN